MGEIIQLFKNKDKDRGIGMIFDDEFKKRIPKEVVIKLWQEISLEFKDRHKDYKISLLIYTLENGKNEVLTLEEYLKDYRTRMHDKTYKIRHKNKIYIF